MTASLILWLVLGVLDMEMNQIATQNKKTRLKEKLNSIYYFVCDCESTIYFKINLEVSKHKAKH